MAKRKGKDQKKQLKRAIQRKKESDFLKKFTVEEIELIKAECSTVISILRKGPELSTALEIARNAIGFADHLIQQAIIAEPLPEPIACKKGCAYCCHFLTELTPPEVILVTEYLKATLSDYELIHTRERIADLEPITRDMTEDERSSSQLPCALLVDNLCIVYPVRPLQCRGYNSVDANSCKLRYEAGDPNMEIVGYYGPPILTFSIQLGIWAGLDASGLDPLILELTRGLRIALEIPDVAEQWLRGTPVFAQAQSKGGIKFSSRFWSKFHPEKGGDSDDQM